MVVCVSSLLALRSLNCSRKLTRSLRKVFIRSTAFSAFAALSSFLLRSAYSSIVREKDVIDALICPCSERDGVVGGSCDNCSRSARIAEDCLSAELNIEF